MRWRPTTRARLIGRALSHALVYHKHGGAQRSGALIVQESKGIQLSIFKHWLDAYPFELWMKTLFSSVCAAELKEHETQVVSTRVEH